MQDKKIIIQDGDEMVEIENEATLIQQMEETFEKKPTNPTKTLRPLVKITLGEDEYIHFSNSEFNPELADRNNFVVMGSKTYYKSLKPNRIRATHKLRPKS